MAFRLRAALAAVALSLAGFGVPSALAATLPVTCGGSSTQATCACPIAGPGVECLGGQIYGSDSVCHNDPRATNPSPYCTGGATFDCGSRTCSSAAVPPNTYVLDGPSSPQTGFISMTGNITSGGKVTAAGLQLSTAPTTGYVLTSDAGGNAAWVAPATAQWSPSGSNISYSSGRVGIGGPSGSQALNVTGDTGLSGNLFLAAGKSVGVGTSAPGYPLDVASASSTAELRLNDTSGGRLWTGTAYARNFAERWFAGMNASTDDFVFRRNGVADVLTISNAGGAVTVGTSLSTPALAVTGGAPAAGKVLTADASGNATWQAVPPPSLAGYVQLSPAAQQTGSINVNGAVTSGGNIVAGGSFSTNGTLSAKGITNVGAITQTGTADISGAVTLGSTLDVTGTTLFRNDVSVITGKMFSVSRTAPVGADPAGVLGSIYYNTTSNKFRCLENAAWKDCITTSGAASWTPSGSDIASANSGNVGVGVAAPAYKLDVAGTTRSTNFQALGSMDVASGGTGLNFNTQGYSFRGNGGDTDGGMFSPADGTLVFATNNGERMRLDPAGNLGLGKSPSVRLDVSGAIAATGLVSSGNAVRAKGSATVAAGGSGTDYANQGFTFAGNGGDNDSGMYSPGDGILTWSANNGERMRLTSSGLGIGLSGGNPKASLSFGSSNVGLPNSYANYRLLLWDSGNAANSYGLGIDNNTLWLNSHSATKFFVDADEKAVLDAAGNLQVDGRLTASASGAPYLCGGDDACLWDVDAAGYVGIRKAGSTENEKRGGLQLGSEGVNLWGESGKLTSSGTVNVNVDGNILQAQGNEAIAYNWDGAKQFSWGYGGQGNLFGGKVGVGIGIDGGAVPAQLNVKGDFLGERLVNSRGGGEVRLSYMDGGVQGIAAGSGTGVVGSSPNGTGLDARSDTKLALYAQSSAPNANCNVSFAPCGAAWFYWSDGGDTTKKAEVNIGTYGTTDITNNGPFQTTTGPIGIRAVVTSPAGVGIVASGTKADFVATGSGPNFVGSSSKRWKVNVEPLDGALDTVSKLRGVSFDWDKAHGGAHDIGFIAEDVGKVVPEIVVWDDPAHEYALGLDYGRVTPLLVNALQELNAQVKADVLPDVKALQDMNAAQQAQLDQQAKTIAELKARLDRIEAQR